MDVTNNRNLIPGGLMSHIRHTYGDDVFSRCKNIVNLNRKLASLSNRVIFLLQCRSKEVFPSHIINNIRQVYTLELEEHPYSYLVDRTMKKFRKSILNIEIKISIWKRDNTEQKLRKAQEWVVDKVNSTTYSAITGAGIRNFQKVFQRVKTENIKKLDRLIVDQRHPVGAIQSDRFVNNYTDVAIPEEVKLILGLGPKHGIIPDHIPKLQLIKDIENFTQTTFQDEDERNQVRGRCVGIINNFVRMNRQPKDPFKQHFIRTGRFIKEHPEIIIGNSDKGNTTVIMYKDEYVTEAKKMLNDGATYRALPSDPTKRIQNKINNYLKLLKKDSIITESQYKMLISYNNVAPKIYFLRKTHKREVKLRPVVSSIKSPSYKIAKFLHEILSDVLSTSVFDVKNSFMLVEELKSTVVPDGYELVSLDVISLFTNIPKELVIKTIKDQWHYIKNFTNLRRKEFVHLVDLCFEGGYFVFEGVFYDQIEGTAMGSPASSTFAKLVMLALFTYVISKLNFHIPLIKLYVDDTLLLIPKEKIEETLNVFNSFHQKIRFTLEREKNRSIPFLDILIIREKNRLKTNWYTKPINTGRCVNFHSNHSFSQKRNIAGNLINRAISLSDEEYRINNLNKVTEILKQNNYPTYYIKTCINIYNRAKRTIRSNIDTDVETVSASQNTLTSQHITTKKYFKLVFYPTLSYKIERIFREYNGDAAFYNVLNNKMKFYTKLKERTPILQQSEIVYKIECNNCTKCYIGQTKQLLQERIRQHKNDAEKSHITQGTALAAHVHAEGHKFNFSEVTVLDYEPIYGGRLISEMVHIRSNNTVNYREDVQHLSLVYDSLILGNAGVQ
ncbi:uncharacterized protein LOC123321050 [Coccinella septempunctata]|uniref:uncharacterized protein LOC123321050 n=1 Tax=Coccinella septempunctata TaxID=41139 RepID=UPI001D0959FB|nr:uncharacterized protein LOC123321050 [Coccinella septempunctata]